MAKKAQALKFTKDLEDDLKLLASKTGFNYNNYVESILSKHVITQKRIIKEMARIEEMNSSLDKESNEVKEVKEEEWV